MAVNLLVFEILNALKNLIFYFIFSLATAAYWDLIQILINPQFNPKHLTTNLQTFKKQCEQLLLIKIQSHVIPINIKNTSSTTKDSAWVYYFSLIEHL